MGTQKVNKERNKEIHVYRENERDWEGDRGEMVRLIDRKIYR